MICCNCHSTGNEHIGYDNDLKPVYGCSTCKEKIIRALKKMLDDGVTFLIALYNTN